VRVNRAWGEEVGGSFPKKNMQIGTEGGNGQRRNSTSRTARSRAADVGGSVKANWNKQVSRVSKSTVVALERCADYQSTVLAAQLDRLVTALDETVVLRGTRVLLKPNLLSARGGGAGCTDAAFIVGVAGWLTEQGARVTVGDSPAFGSAGGILQALGIRETLAGLGVQVSDFRSGRKLALASGRTATLAAEALDCELLVNLPRVKAHAQVRITLAVKNLFGCVLGMQKPWWHMVHGGAHGSAFAGMIVDLLGLLPPTLSLVDGRVAMHETGPLDGRPYPLELIGASWNPVALDSALLAVLGVEPASCPLWEVCARRNLPGVWLTELDFPLRGPDELAAPAFRVPARLHSVRFNPFRFLRSSLKRVLLRLRPADRA